MGVPGACLAARLVGVHTAKFAGDAASPVFRTVDALWAGLGELDDAEARRHQLAYDQAPEDTPDAEESGDPRWRVMYALQLLIDAVDAARPDGGDVASATRDEGGSSTGRPCGGGLT